MRPFSVMMGDGLTRHWQLFFLQGQETYPRQRDGRAAAIRPFAGTGDHQAGGKGCAPTLQYEQEQGAFFDGSRLSVGRAFTISGRPQNRVIEKSIRPPVPKDGLGPHP